MPFLARAAHDWQVNIAQKMVMDQTFVLLNSNWKRVKEKIQNLKAKLAVIFSKIFTLNRITSHNKENARLELLKTRVILPCYEDAQLNLSGTLETQKCSIIMWHQMTNIKCIKSILVTAMTV